jgi:MFS family permease
MVLLAIFLALILFTTSVGWLLACLFGMGLALGCDYPTAHLVISESSPTRRRGRLVLSAFGFQAVGALAGVATGILMLYADPDVGAWRWMYAAALLPAVAVAVGRLFVTESPHWLASRGKARAAEQEVCRLLHRDPPYPKSVSLAAPDPAGAASSPARGYASLFRGRNLRATVLASVPWFLQDLGTYGIGIFTPTLLAAVLGHDPESVGSVAALVHRDIVDAKGAVLVDSLLVAGIAAAVLLADRVSRIRLQVLGFVGCAIGLFLAAMATTATGESRMMLILAGFMLFNFSTNIGPNAQTYLLAGEVFPTPVRARGAGFAASFAKIGAVVTAFLFPILLADLGTAPLLYVLVATSLLGAAITWTFRIETTNVSLDEVRQSIPAR